MPTRILHVSDLHFGTREDPAVERAVADLIGAVEPALVIATGDLTHRGRPEQHDRVARFLTGLGPPVLAVPGNHDIPYTFPARFTQPWRQFERHWGTTEPEYAAAGVYEKVSAASGVGIYGGYDQSTWARRLELTTEIAGNPAVDAQKATNVILQLLRLHGTTNQLHVPDGASFYGLRAVDLSDANLATVDDLDHVIHRRHPKTGEALSTRWVILHMIEEYARHNGHADLIRESIDGQPGE